MLCSCSNLKVKLKSPLSIVAIWTVSFGPFFCSSLSLLSDTFLPNVTAAADFACSASRDSCVALQRERKKFAKRFCETCNIMYRSYGILHYLCNLQAALLSAFFALKYFQVQFLELDCSLSHSGFFHMYDMGVSYSFHFHKKNTESPVIFLRNDVLILNGKENKEASAICFEIRILKKNNEEILRKVPSKIYEVCLLWKKTKKKLVC